MKKSIQKLLWLLPLLYLNPASAGVDCAGTPHTRIEISVCGEPVLQALDQELTHALKSAQRRGLIDKSAVLTTRNQIARQCWRQTDEQLNACLLDSELKALIWVQSRLDGDTDSQIDPIWHYREGMVSHAVQLQKQLLVAERRLQKTRDPRLTVVTVVDLIRLFEQQLQLQPGAVEADAAIAQLQQRLVSGCNHAAYAKKWQAAVVASGQNCQALQSAAVLSASDFH